MTLECTKTTREPTIVDVSYAGHHCPVFVLPNTDPAAADAVNHAVLRAINRRCSCRQRSPRHPPPGPFSLLPDDRGSSPANDLNLVHVYGLRILTAVKGVAGDENPRSYLAWSMLLPSLGTMLRATVEHRGGVGLTKRKYFETRSTLDCTI